MGLSYSMLSSVWKIVVKHRVFGLEIDMKDTVIMRSLGLDDDHKDVTSRSVSLMESENVSASQISTEKTIERSLSFKNWEPEKVELETADSFTKQSLEIRKPVSINTKIRDKDEAIQSEARKFLSVLASPRPMSELDAAAVKLQKVYKSYRTRRNLADCAVVVEELWWKALDFAALKQSSVSYFDIEKPETAFHRWTRARTRAAKVGKGLSKDEKARKLALQHWLEAIDPRHRYGHNLHFYYDIWFDSDSSQPFFYWLDVGNGKEINIDKCPRNDLQRQCIKYLGPNEREAYEVIVDSGILVYKQSGLLVDTDEDSKWIFVLSTSRSLYVGQKKKGVFQHSSFLSGGATTAAGRLVAKNGVLKVIWPYSGHYLPTEDNFQVFISFLEEHNVDLTNVKRCAANEDSPSFHIPEESQGEDVECPSTTEAVVEFAEDTTGLDDLHNEAANTEAAPAFDFGRHLSCKWTTGTGPRIGCVRDYPMDLQSKALEQVNLSPRIDHAPFGPIPSPRPSPKIRLSPRLAYMGLPSPRVTLPNSK